MYVDDSDHLQSHMTGLLMKHFGLNSFKDWQLHIIKATLEGRNSFVVQPTGSGKSICFQLPSLITGKITVVLTPTISLMSDQCNGLQHHGIPATFLGSGQVDNEVGQKIEDGMFQVFDSILHLKMNSRILVALTIIQVVYTTPESFFDNRGAPSNRFSCLIQKGQIGLIAIDEVHLVNNWKCFRYNTTDHYYFIAYIFGYNRPAFGHIFELCDSSPCPIMALTATATPSLKKEIIQHLSNPVLSIGSVNQENLFYSVHELHFQQSSRG